MSILSKQNLEAFRQLTDKVDVGILAIADNEMQEIIFASNIHTLLGYKESELIGKPLEMLIPIRFRDGHKSNMQRLKDTVGAEVSRPMCGDRILPALSAFKDKNGYTIEVLIKIDISYHHSTAATEPGIFLGLIQDPRRTVASPQMIGDLKVQFSTIAYNTKSVAKFAYGSFLKWVSGAGIGVVLLFFLTFTRESIATWNAITTIFGNRNVVKNLPKNNPSLQLIDGKLRLQNMITIRNKILQDYPDRVKGVAFYELLGDRQPFLRYAGDTGGTNPDEQELFFLDFFSGKNRISLNADQVNNLRDYECIVLVSGGTIPDKNDEVFNIVACPTVIVKTDIATGLQYFDIANVIALGITTDVSETDATKLFGGLIFKYSPSVEPIFSKE